jgi:hypothetical protein
MPYFRIPCFFNGCCALTRSWRARRAGRDVRAAAFCTAPTIHESREGARRKYAPILGAKFVAFRLSRLHIFPFPSASQIAR